MCAIGGVPRVTGRTGAGTLEGRAFRRGGHEVQATGPIEDLAQTWLATRLQGALLATVQLVQEYLVTAAGGQSNDTAWCGPGDPRIGHS
jgi:hypothetical protein